MSKPHLMPAPLTQQAFPFVTDEDILEQAEAYVRMQQRRVARILKFTSIPNVTVEVLKRPIFTKKGEAFLAEIETQIEFVFNVEPTQDDKDEDLEAILNNQFKFVASYLETVLDGLADMGGVDEKIDTLEWIFADYLPEERTEKSGRKSKIATDKMPFSFNWSCALLGLDPEKMRDEICIAIAGQQREVEARILKGELQPSRRNAVATAVAFINERTSI